MAMKLQTITTKWLRDHEKLNDIGIRAVLVPLFGIGIPLIVNLVPHEKFTHWQIKLSYLYTIVMSWLIYEGTRFLQFTLRSYFDWFKKPIRKLLAFLLVIPFFGIVVSVLLMAGWYNLFMDGDIQWPVVKQTVIVIMVCVLFLVNVYETIFLVRDVANDKIKKEQLERAKAEAELQALKNQVDPHFVFNSLNTLSHLIETNPAKAQRFNDNLADVYRYMLSNKSRDLVLLKEEVAFLRDYFSLLQIRFEHAVQLHMRIPQTHLNNSLLPPICLQVLAENAIKHNDFSDTHPLMVTIESTDDVLIISNEIRKKAIKKPSSKIGLENLDERYKLLTGKAIEVKEEDGYFRVVLPLMWLA